MKKYGDGQVQELSAYFLRNRDFWQHMNIQGSQWDADDFALCLHFEDHILNDPDTGTLGNYFIGSRRERVPNQAVNNTAASRGAMIFDAPGRWHGIEALPGLQFAVAQDNLFLNPSFEIGVGDWLVSNGTITQSRKYARDGGHSMKYVNNGAATGYVTKNALIPAAALTDYGMGVWIYVESGNAAVGDTVTLGAWEYDGGGAFLGTFIVFSNCVLHVGWNYCRGVATTGAATANLRPRVTSLAINSTLWFDCFVFDQCSFVPTWFDGDSGDGCSWSGTPHASASARTANWIELDHLVDRITDQNEQTHIVWLRPYYDYDEVWPGAGTSNIVWDLRGANDNNRIYLCYDATNQYFDVYINGAHRLAGTGYTFEREQLICAVVTCDFTNDVYKLFIDGELIDTDTTALTAPTAVADWACGAAYNGSLQTGAYIYEYVTLTRALNDAEVADHYATGLPVVDPGGLEKDRNCGIVLWQNANQNIPSGAPTRITFDTVIANEHMVWDIGNDQIVITEPGWYNMAAQCRWATNNAGTFRDIRIVVNGNNPVFVRDSPAQGTIHIQNGSAVRYLQPGDVISLQVTQDSGGGLTITSRADATPILSVVKIRNVFSPTG